MTLKFYTLGAAVSVMLVASVPLADAAAIEACTRKNVLVEVFTSDGSETGNDVVAELRDDPRSILVTRALPHKGGKDRLADYVGKEVQWVTTQRPQVVLGGQVGLDLSDDGQIKEIVDDLQKQSGVAVRRESDAVMIDETGTEAELRFLALASKQNNKVVAEVVTPCSAKGCREIMPKKLRKAKGADRWVVVLQSPETGRVLAAEWLSHAADQR